MRFNFIKTCALLVLGLSLSSCAEDGKKSMEKMLAGKWELTEAYRNDRKTETLNSLYLIFGAGNQLETNLYGESKKTVYELKNNMLIQKDSLNTTFNIESLSDTTLRLTTVIQQQNFRFGFTKSGVVH